jgi:PrgI family protein
MPRVYELPTHLDVQDTLIFGLTARQLVRLAVGASIASAFWDQAAALPGLARLALTSATALAGLLFAFFQPGARPLDQWLLAAAVFWILPRRQLWRRDAQSLRPLHQAPVRNWAELQPEPEWTITSTTAHNDSRRAKFGGLDQ